LPPRSRKFSNKSDADPTLRAAFNTVFGEKVVAVRNPQILIQFQYNIADNDTTTTVANGGTVTQDDSMAVLTSSTATDGSARLESKDTLRYQPGCEGYALFTSLWANGGVAGAKQFCGLFSSTDGYFLGYDGTDFVAGKRKDSTDSTVKQGNFNLDHLDGTGASGFNLDTSKLNIFAIDYGWLGTAPITFYVMDDDNNWIAFHRFNYPGTLTGPHTSNPVLPLCFDITKTSGATSLVMKTASWQAGFIGNTTPVTARYFSGAAGALAVTTEAVLINFRNQDTFQSKTNRVVAQGVFVSASSDGNKPAKIKIYKNLTITGASWSDVDADNSVLQTDTSGTITPDDANLLLEIPLGRQDSQSEDISNLAMFIRPGESFSITGQSSVGNDLEFFARWRELF
jgi:hypothetical protein